MKYGNKIKRIRKIYRDDFTVSLEFQDGFVGKVNLSPLFANRKKPLVAEILRGDIFGSCFVESGALAWPNGYELCPDSLRSWMADGIVKVAA